MPFKSKAQMRLFFAKQKRGELPEGTAEAWAAETPNIEKLPDHVKKACLGYFVKIAKRLFDPKNYPPVPAATTQSQLISAAKEDKMKGMTSVEYRNDLTQRRTGIIARNKQSARAS